MTFRIIYIGVPRCPLNHIYFFFIRVLVMVIVRETLYDVVMSEYWTTFTRTQQISIFNWQNQLFLHAPHVCFSFWCSSLTFSVKQRREMTKFDLITLNFQFLFPDRVALTQVMGSKYTNLVRNYLEKSFMTQILGICILKWRPGSRRCCPYVSFLCKRRAVRTGIKTGCWATTDYDRADRGIIFRTK